MSNVSTKYSTTANSNVKLGSISLKENETRYRDINDLFRRLMADIRQESNEVRSLISTASSKASTAKATADSVGGEVNEITRIVNAVRSDVTASRQTAENAENAAEQAASSASASASQAASATASLSSLQTTISSTQSGLTSLTNRVTTLENAAAASSGVALVDDTTIEYRNGDMTAVDVAISGDLADLASARGQIGRTAVAEGADVNDLLTDGWYAVGGTGTANLPEGVTIGVCRVSSGFATDSVCQTFFSVNVLPRLFIRYFNGTNFTDWREPLFSNAVGSGLAFNDGVISADLSAVLPVAGEQDYDRCLSGGGTWKDVATPDDLEAVNAALNSFAESLSEIRTALESVEAQVAAEPDGVTVMVVDGAYTVPTYLGATEEEAGIAGLVPAAEIADRDKFLRGDGTWADTAMEPPTFDGETAGLVPAPEEAELEEGAEDRRFLKQDGTWEDPCEDLAERVTALEEESGTEAIMERVAILENGADSEEIDLIFWPPSESSEPEEPGEGGE